MTYWTLSDLSSLQSIAKDVADDLRQGCSLVWLFPNPNLLDQMAMMVTSECTRWGMDVAEVSLTSFDVQSRPPAAQLAEWLGLELPHNGCTWIPAVLIESAGIPDVLLLRDAEQLPDKEQHRWAQFINQWSQAAVTSSTAKALLLPVVAKLAGTVVPDVRLKVRRLWRYTSQLELQTIARGRTGPDLASQVWNEYGYASLAAGDPLLLEWLLDKPDLDGAALWDYLLAYGKEAGWTYRNLSDGGAGQLCDLQYSARMKDLPDVPSAFEGLWRLGAVTYTCEYGLELQSAAAVVLGRRDLVEHRLWRGQVQAVMPVLDTVRQALCHHLTRYHGPGWVNLAEPQYDFEVSGTPERPLSEFNHLSRVLRSSALRIPRRLDLSELVQELRDCRNSLAHYTPIRRADVTRLFQVVRLLESLR